jgi:tight adherence protein C
MGVLVDIFAEMPRIDSATVASILLFLAVSLLTLAVGLIVQGRTAVRRRVSGVTRDAGHTSSTQPRSSMTGRRMAEQISNYANKHFASLDSEAQRVLRKRLVQAGFLSPRAVGVFLLSRLVMLVILSVAGYLILPGLFAGIGAGNRWLLSGGIGLAGYLLPQILLDRRITKRQDQHRCGFPDFMDLMVVCSDAGLSMEAALDRVGRELADSHPSLSTNVHMTILELRAGRPLGEALERLGDRLGIDEARSFATLLQQSEELGTSLTETLRVYSDDMRHQRLSRAEEKAYSLPAKLSVPLTLCIFPVVMVVTMLPVVIRFRDAGF